MRLIFQRLINMGANVNRWFLMARVDPGVASLDFFAVFSFCLHGDQENFRLGWRRFFKEIAMENEFIKQLSGLFPLLVFVGFVLFAFYMIKRSQQQLRAKLEPIAMSLGGEVVSGLLVMNYIKLINYEKEQRVGLMPGGKNSPPSLVLSQFTDLDFDLTIMKENKVTLTMEKWGLNIEMKSGDPVFDEKYLIKSRQKEQAQMFLTSAERKLIIDFFFDAGYTTMTLQLKTLSFSKPNYTDRDLDPNLLRAQLDQLHKLLMG
jgi:hypothetical protein